MKFIEYYKASSPEHKKWLAKRLDSSLAYLSQIANGHRNPSKRFIFLLEQITGERFDFGN